ncbi:DUF3143 domain-containing protein [Thermosynechococcaceae cyanobacterium BACA0444]|uniref:DUF3143 domain-containing protein n=1 Tax=Pseudocalidococcus azoricus BACA0444 TaxID=2918990 RepID=A0AAE4FPK9_9CYAN|nr:DUF3143 domain-containing protein [Pseudocalidococcus azoricus]MDS3859771.1 DUF3143 domain-containing protein [Pseudocalidococcus azoricus BACA0444]
MNLPAPDTPLYNHPLPLIEAWLREHGCVQHREQLHCWQLKTPQWQAWISLDIEELTVLYEAPGHQVKRAFKYSLSREDVESAVFAGP